MIYNGGRYTPTMILSEVQRNTPLGRELSSNLSVASLAPREELVSLAKERLFILFDKRPAKIDMITPEGIPGEQTSEDLRKSVETHDILGKSLIENEIGYMYRLIRY